MTEEYIKLKDVKIGDIIESPDGLVEVSNVFEEHVPKEMFKVSTKKSAVNASGNHLWYVESELNRQGHKTRLKSKHFDFDDGTIKMLEEGTKHEWTVSLNDMWESLESTCEKDYFDCVRIARSIGPIEEEHVFFDDSEVSVELTYDGKLFCQQLLSLANIDTWRKKCPPIVGEVLSTKEMKNVFSLGIKMFIPKGRIVDIEEIEPVLSRCISVNSRDKLFVSHGEIGDEGIVSHNSVIQRNIIFGCIMRPENWGFIGIDLKKVELSMYRQYDNVVLGIATTLEDALTSLRFAQMTMMKRYATMEQLGVNNFLDLPERGQALMVMIDEAGELLGSNGVRALSENTIIPTPDGDKLLKDLSVGDTVYNSESELTKVNVKYRPEHQDKYTMRISRDKDNASEKFIAGSDHDWVAYFEYPNGTIVGPEVVDTKYFYDFKEEQEQYDKENRVKIKFKKYVNK